jgi:predicted porin
MKKNAIALAVGALCIAPAAQAQIVFGNDTIGTVQFYGKLYPEVVYGTSSGATGTTDTVATLAAAPTGNNPGGRLAVDSQNSYLGFRGERKLGSTGLKGLWQIEQSIEIDTGTDATFSSRNSFLGLGGGFGTVKLGHMDTIYKEYGAVVGMFGITSGNFVSPSNVLSRIGIGTSSAGRFHERAANTIQYQSPEFSGIQFGAQYSPDETKNDVGNTLNRELWSFGVKYEAGPLYVSLQHELHKDFFGGSNAVATTFRNLTTAGAHSRDRATRLSATYKLGNHKLAADISQLQWTESGQAAGTAKFDEYKHISWAVGVESKWGGPVRTSFEYVQAQPGTCKITIGDCNTDGLKGQLIAAGVAYDLDKNTFLFLIGAKLINGKSAIYDNWAASTPQRGGDVTQAAVGMTYKF